MDALSMRLHPGLIPDGSRNWRQRQHSPHLRQGSIDAAAGPLCTYMAMIVLGLASKDQVKSLRHGSDYRFGKTWIKSLDTFFLGASADDLLELLAALDSYLIAEAAIGPTRVTLEFAQRRLARNELVILGLGQETRYGEHWVLAVGTAAVLMHGKRSTTGLLCLDPAEPAPWVAQFNARLSLDSPRRGARYLHYAVPNAIQSVNCSTAIALSLRR